MQRVPAIPTNIQAGKLLRQIFGGLAVPGRHVPARVLDIGMQAARGCRNVRVDVHLIPRRLTFRAVKIEDDYPAHRPRDNGPSGGVLSYPIREFG